MKGITIIGLGILLGVSGCETPKKLNTPSGMAEVTIQGKPAAVVQTAVVSAMVDRGFLVKSSSPGVVVAEKMLTDMGSQLFFGSLWNRTPAGRYTANVLDLGQGVRVVMNYQIITNPNSGHEQALVVDGSKMLKQETEMLAAIKTNLEKQP
jgi:hypothetical protein